MHISTCTLDGKITSRSYDFDREDPEDLYELITQYFLLYPRRKYRSRNLRARGNRLPIRASLFPHVAPYVEFQLRREEGFRIPEDVAHFLQWNLTPTTPSIVQKIVRNTGYRLVHGCVDWCGSWNESTYVYVYKTLKNFQKLNHFPGSYEIGHKDRLCRNMNRLIAVHGRKQFGFVPRTYILPHDYELLCSAWLKGERKKWILKPPASSCGRGIKLINRWTQIPRQSNYVVVQRYLSKPKLINGNKFDLRLYVLITSFDPLRIYFYQDGLVRFACAKYKNSASTLGDHFMHLTNYSVNRYCADYVSNNDVDSCTGHKWSLKCLWSQLESQGINTEQLLGKIHDMIVKTVIAGEQSINSFSRVYVSSRYNCYELLGVDVLLDQDMKPWLLEVNISPSLQTPSALDEAIKGPLIRDALNLACYQIPSDIPGRCFHRVVKKRKLGKICQDFEFHRKSLTTYEKLKQQRFANVKRREDYLRSILEDLTPDDVRQLIHYEDELDRAGSFRKIFPSRHTHRYFKYFGNLSYQNRLFDAWETAYADSRKDGISRLGQLCAAKYHLSR